MLRNLLLTIGFILSANLVVFGQLGSGALKGKIVDKDTKEPIPFANIVLEVGVVAGDGGQLLSSCCSTCSLPKGTSTTE